MRVGIDFGTTRTEVALQDRGNYPVLGFIDAAGDSWDWFPSVIAERDGELRFGFDALASDKSWSVMRSFKRLLANPRVNAEEPVTIGATVLPTSELLTRFLTALRTAVFERSNLPADKARDRELEAVVAVPANALGAQRFLTLDAFRRAGFEVLAMLNEPSAAGFEYTHRHGDTLSSKREHIVVYDLGGGTFDASLVRLQGAQHDVVATSGLSRLGGDDFDDVLLDLTLEKARLKPSDLSRRQRAVLLDHCREAKERLTVNSKRISVDLEAVLGKDAPLVTVTLEATDYYAACQPLVDKTLQAMEPVVAQASTEGTSDLNEVAGVYVVGGGSALPVVARTLRDRFGRRVRRSPYPAAAVAIGLAIAADEQAGFKLADRFSRNFGVFREGLDGQQVTFDLIFTRAQALPTAEEKEIVSRRLYRAAHNLGHYRFIECATLDAPGEPKGEIMPFADVLFPFDRALRNAADLRSIPVRRLEGEGPLIEERYAIDRNGIVEVQLAAIDDGFRQVFKLGRR